MVEIGKKCNKNMTAILTNMDEPLGLAVGNSLEVIEAINTLNGHGPADFNELCLTFAAHLIYDAKGASTLEEARKLAKRQIENKEALHTLAKLIKAQGGDESYIYNPEKFPKAKYVVDVIAKESGYVSKIDALAIGNAAMHLGAGRAKLTDNIDHSVGIILNKKVGFEVSKGDVLATIYANKEDVFNESNMILNAYNISSSKVDANLILKIVK
jgi:pyrimidine-nucleoside phosphorylase